MAKASYQTDSKYDYDYFVIGGGSGGVRSSRIAAQFGARVALAEENKLGKDTLCSDTADHCSVSTI